MFLTLNTDPLNIQDLERITYPAYMWAGDTGELINLSDSTRHAILREGIFGFTETPKTLNTETNPNYYGKKVTRRVYGERSCGFRVLINGETKQRFRENRDSLLAALSKEGTLVVTSETGVTRYLRVELAPDRPNLSVLYTGGDNTRTNQIAEFEFTATDPFFYSSTERAEAGADNVVTVYNLGDTPAPCKLSIVGNTCTNEANGKTITCTAPAIVDITDEGVKTDASMGTFGINSQFFMLEPGKNRITGVAWVEFASRWAVI